MLINKLKKINIITPKNQINRNSKNILNQHHDIQEEINNCTDFLDLTTTIIERIYCIKNNITAKPLCPVCNKPLKFNYLYKKYCSNKCSANSPEIKEKIKSTVSKKFGYENVSQAPSIKEKKKNTSLQRYGVEYTLQEPTIRKQIKKTNLKKYGNICPMGCKNVLEKTKQTNLKKYGVENVSQSSKIRQKKIYTWKNKYGVSNPNQIHISIETLEKLNNKEWLIQQHITQKKSLLQIAIELNVSDITIKRYCNKHNIETIYHTNKSQEEINLFNMITTLTDVEQGNNNIIAPYQIDIYIPKHKLAIEYCGLYWHSEKYKDKWYHKTKLDKCNQNNTRLLTIFEDEWLYKKYIVTSTIQYLLHMTTTPTLYARNTTIDIVNSIDRKRFLEKYHIQGDGIGSITYGLYYENIIVAVTTYKENKNNYILNRFATSQNVVGGFSKLLKHFRKNNINKPIITFADLRWSNGNLYEKTGFKVDKILPPDYYYTKGTKRYHKFNFRHKYLYKYLPDYDSTLTEKENMDKSNYNKIWNCGYKRYILR